jgi:hypothetical protein
LGIAGSSGILEATVVEGEIPLLLPIKMLRQLRAVIDLEQSCLKFSGMEYQDICVMLQIQSAPSMAGLVWRCSLSLQLS